MMHTNVGDPQENDDKTKVEIAATPPGKDQVQDSAAVQTSKVADTSEESEELEIIELEDLEDIEFLIDEIEDQIAPLAL